MQKSRERYQTIKAYTDNIKRIYSKQDKILCAKEILITTDIIKSENTLIQFDDEQWYLEENSLKKFLEYRKSSSPIYRGVDCDVSLFCVVMYSLLDEKYDLNYIYNQYSSSKKYEIDINNRKFKGDTLTSALYLLKLYLGSLWKHIENNDDLKALYHYNTFYNLFPGVANTGIPISPTEDWNSYCYKNSNIIWDVMDNAAKQFLNNYHMFGNYMCIPGKSYKTHERRWTSFNMARSNMGKWDTIDTLLAKLYAFFNFSDPTYLEAIFTEKHSELIEETKQWLSGFDDWSDFLSTNSLEAFVDRKTSIPISLKTGEKININEDLHTYNPIPQTYDEFLVFFEQAATRIALRSEYIYKKLYFTNGITSF